MRPSQRTLVLSFGNMHSKLHDPTLKPRHQLLFQPSPTPFPFRGTLRSSEESRTKQKDKYLSKLMEALHLIFFKEMVLEPVYSG